MSGGAKKGTRMGMLSSIDFNISVLRPKRKDSATYTESYGTARKINDAVIWSTNVDVHVITQQCSVTFDEKLLMQTTNYA